ncbi:hypothetical protein Ancab_014599 [Ancistrocladus abbreviatus]
MHAAKWSQILAPHCFLWATCGLRVKHSLAPLLTKREITWAPLSFRHLIKHPSDQFQLLIFLGLLFRLCFCQLALLLTLTTQKVIMNSLQRTGTWDCCKNGFPLLNIAKHWWRRVQFVGEAFGMEHHQQKTSSLGPGAFVHWCDTVKEAGPGLDGDLVCRSLCCFVFFSVFYGLFVGVLICVVFFG